MRVQSGNTMSTARTLFLAFACLSRPLYADDDPAHSKHGEAFDEGPRQAAVLMLGTGKIHFPITTQSKEAQQFFEQGVGQLHGFWYYESERSFRQAAALDPEAAMPFWGMAMANLNNEKRAKAFVAAALLRKHTASAREQAWIETLRHFYNEAADDKRDKKQRALDYISDLETIVQDNPNDIEAKAFLAWKIYDANGLAPITSKQAVDTILDQIFAAQPDHPAYHYRIHLWDSSKPKLALGATALCGQVAPGIAHMWHMPGHTFSKLKRFDDAAWQQEAATRCDHAYMIRSLVLPDRIHNYAHNEEWLIRTWNEQGRASDGIALAKALIENPRHPELNNLDKQSTSASYGRTRLLDTLVLWELWPQLLQLNDSPYLQPVVQTRHEVARLCAVGLAQYSQNNSKALASSIAALEALEKKDQQATDKKTAEAKAKPADKPATPASTPTDKVNKEVRKAITVANQPAASPPQKATPTAKKIPVVATIGADGKPKPSTTQPAAKPAANLDQKQPIAQALAELRAAQLILDKAPAEKIRAALVLAKDSPKDRLAHYYLRLGEKADKTKAGELAGQLTQDLHGLAIQAELYLALDRKDEAKKAFEQVRERAFAMNRDLPLAKRLDDLAPRLGFTHDNWSKPAPVRTDVGQRPSLDSLGPVHWHAPAAPAWAGTGLDGKPVSSADYAGKPTLLLFYVGHNCVHCVNQLKAFETIAPEFKKLGIAIVALSPDTPEELPKAQKYAASKSGFPFPLVSAQSMETFRAYRAYDDFEKLPLHAAALIDAGKQLRWLDVSYKPFMEAKFLLEESQRLLGLPSVQVAKQ